MGTVQEYLLQSRRQFLTGAAGGIGTLALASLMRDEGLLGSEIDNRQSTIENPLALKPPHFTPRAKSCIFVYLYGGASHLDLFDPKPKLNELNGLPLPESLAKNVRFAFVQKQS